MSESVCIGRYLSFVRIFRGITCTVLMVLLLSLLPLAETAQAQACIPNAVKNAKTDPWSWQCYLNQSCQEQGTPCTANDVRLLGAYLADASGAPLGACQAGQPVQAYLWGLFKCNAANRYAIRAYTEVYLDGAYQTYLNSCAFDHMVAGQSSYALLGIINYTCGQQFSLRNTWVAWDTNAAVFERSAQL